MLSFLVLLFLSLLFAFVFVLFCQLIHWFSRLLIGCVDNYYNKIRNIFCDSIIIIMDSHTQWHTLSIRTWHNHLHHLMHTHRIHESQTTNRTPALNDREKFIESAQTPIRKNQRKKRRTKNTQKKLIHFLRRCLFPCVWKFNRMFSMCVCVFFLLLLFHNFSVRSSRWLLSERDFFPRSIIKIVSGMFWLNCPICLTDSIVARHSVFLAVTVTSLFLFFFFVEILYLRFFVIQ